MLFNCCCSWATASMVAGSLAITSFRASTSIWLSLSAMSGRVCIMLSSCSVSSLARLSCKVPAISFTWAQVMITSLYAVLNRSSSPPIIRQSTTTMAIAAHSSRFWLRSRARFC